MLPFAFRPSHLGQSSAAVPVEPSLMVMSEDLACHEDASWLSQMPLELFDRLSTNSQHGCLSASSISSRTVGLSDDDDDLTCNEEVADYYCSDSGPLAREAPAPISRPLSFGPAPKLQRSLSEGTGADVYLHPLCRNRSFSSMGVSYRQSAVSFYSQHLPCVHEGFPDVAEMLGNMAAHSEQHYRLSPAYVHALLGTAPGSAHESFGHGYTSLTTTGTATQLAAWRQGSVKWFAKVVERFEANREIIATAVNFLDRYVQSQLSTGDLSSRQAFEHAVVCSFLLAWKMHQGDTVMNPKELSRLCSEPPSLKHLCALEFKMMAALHRHLNPPTAGTLIHHLLSYLPDSARPLLFSLDDRANDLALLALESPEFLSFPVLAVALASILAACARLRADGVGLSEGVELTWLRTLDERHVSVSPEAVDGSLHLLATLTNSADAHMDQAELPPPPRIHLDQGWGGSWGGHCQLDMLYLPDFLCDASPKALQVSGSSCWGGRSDSPTGVAEVFALDAHDQPPKQSLSASARGTGTTAVPSLLCRPQPVTTSSGLN